MNLNIVHENLPKNIFHTLIISYILQLDIENGTHTLRIGTQGGFGSITCNGKSIQDQVCRVLQD